MPPEAANEQLDAFKRIISECRPFRDLENINVHRDGSLHVMQTSGMPIIDDQGNVLGYRGLDRDITLKKSRMNSWYCIGIILKIWFLIVPRNCMQR